MNRRAQHLAAGFAIALCMVGAALSVLCWFLAIWESSDDTAIRLFLSGSLGFLVSATGGLGALGVYDDTRGPR